MLVRCPICKTTIINNNYYGTAQEEFTVYTLSSDRKMIKQFADGQKISLSLKLKSTVVWHYTSNN